jgi:hypothetical protein
LRKKRGAFGGCPPFKAARCSQVNGRAGTTFCLDNAGDKGKLVLCPGKTFKNSQP